MPYFKLVLACGLGVSMIGLMIPTYLPDVASAVIRAHGFSTATIADAFLSMREWLLVILPDSTEDDAIRDVAWAIVHDGYDISIDDAIIAVRYSIDNPSCQNLEAVNV